MKKVIENHFTPKGMFLGNRLGANCQFISFNNVGIRTYKQHKAKGCKKDYFLYQKLSGTNRVPKVLSEIKSVKIHGRVLFYFIVQKADYVVSDILTPEECKEVHIRRKQDPFFRWHDLDKYNEEYEELKEIICNHMNSKKMRDTHKENFGYINNKLVLLDVQCSYVRK